MSAAALSFKERFRLSRFVRGEAPVDRPIALTHRRIFILPTLRGLGFALLVTLLLLIAFVYNNNLAYLLAFMLAGVFFVTILHSFNTLAGLVVKPIKGHAAFAGDAAGFELLLGNPLPRPRYNLKLSMQTDIHADLAGAEQKAVVLYAEAPRRGWLPCATVTLSSRYPLGLFRAWSPMRFNLRALVYPRPATVDLAFPESDDGSGEQGQGRKGQDDFLGLKSYQSGDPIRRIHWKAFAKGQGLYSKEYAGAVADRLWLDYEAAPGNDREQRLGRLCRWIIDAEQAGLQYGLILPGTKIEPGHGRGHYERCLEALALF